jgi:hypothetical protein
VERFYGPIPSASEGPLGPPFTLEDVPLEWRALMKRFHSEHVQNESLQRSSRSKSSKNAARAAAASVTTVESARRSQHVGKVSIGKVGAPKAHTSVSVGLDISNEEYTDMDTVEAGTGSETAEARKAAHDALASVPVRDPSEDGAELQALHLSTAELDEGLTRLQPHDGDELTNAAASSVLERAPKPEQIDALSVCDALNRVELPHSKSHVSEQQDVVASENASPSDSSGALSTGRSDAQSTNMNRVHCESIGNGVSATPNMNKTATVIRRAARTTSKPELDATKSATGKSCTRISERVRSISSKVSGRIPQESVCDSVASTNLKVNRAPPVRNSFTSIYTLGASNKSASKPTRTARWVATVQCTQK